MCLTRRITPLLLLSVGLLTPIIGNAQSANRSELAKQIETMRNELRQKEDQLLAVSDQDKATYSDFLTQRDTGICRLMPRERYEGNLLIRGGGAYYSFIQSSSDYNQYPQIGLERGQFGTGFIGADFGYISDLGDIPLETLTPSHPAVSELAGFVTPSAEQDARVEQRKSGEGLKLGPHVYKRFAGASAAHTYVLRSVNYDRADILIAFRAVKQDDDGSFILVWRILNRFPSPQLIRSDTH